MLVMGSSGGASARLPWPAIWLGVNLLLDAVLRVGRSRPVRRGSLQPMRIGEGRYLLFLLLMAGFWTSFNQIFMTLPEYIRDYADTRDLIGQPLEALRRLVRVRSAWACDTWSRALAVLDQRARSSPST